MASRSLSRLALAASGVLLTSLLGGTATAQTADTPVFWRVPATATQAQALAAAGFDVEEGDGGSVDVVGGQAVAAKLRALGYRPSYFDTVYKELPARTESLAADTFYGGYRTVTAQENHLAQVASAHPDLATKYTIGQSWKKTKGQGGHDIQAICLTKKQTGDCTLSTTSTKPKFFLMAQIHARELSTGELAWRWIDYLADGYATDATAKSILDTTEVWVVPIANPDGVDIVASGGNSPKLQRKNANNSRGGCSGTNIGVDLNRNSTYRWGGDSNSACAETYQGVSAGSEPEVQALEKLARAIFPDQRGTGNNDPAPATAKGTMITLHSYGNDIIIPWGFTQATSPNDAQYRRLGAKYSASNGYLVGTNEETVGYDTSGTTDDFTYGELGVASVTFEVGGSSGSCGGFLPKYTCVDSTFWPKNKGALVTAAKAAAAPYQQ
ncbi:peptidase M14 carboxypeptidase [Amycolatopsis mediterranei S699]|uniref:Peptidase M14 carboxypeptidase n=3 Tax=Amycolatopsis mediterranei TaxID=33910 RepID=A0A0H3D5P3_AMYMU|nr:M14 family zinc carboxypeptidase [Amycolatopsis mediterranei]ADJ45941.1 peptidase M14 carboxypeptidase [Amycolatopsis mediterranei U32]AEK42722.1 peptidase M14 carboxypeptidase [Amycolatopsis mediterranei S699]AFO77652.1 peptidase M14 carboxypeptidase [Amycolatopsis mediterranei S699]AGT84780.1 peptidase M14 carboxypeptidase [Amycolatopsis mediterranei RB]KDO05475.1 peptidase M14 [Amycolatopsis mediterranei]